MYLEISAGSRREIGIVQEEPFNDALRPVLPLHCSHGTRADLDYNINDFCGEKRRTHAQRREAAGM